MIANPAIAIDSDDKTFMVIWSWGLRCNFDCTYCSPERHNNKSKHTKKEKLLMAVDFLKEYKSILLKSNDDGTIGFMMAENYISKKKATNKV